MKKLLNFFHLLTGLLSGLSSIVGLKTTGVKVVVSFIDITAIDTIIIESVVKLVESHEQVTTTSISGNDLIIELHV